MLDAMEKHIMADLVSLTDMSDPEPPCTPDADTKTGSPGAQDSSSRLNANPIPCPCTSGALPVPGIPAHVPEPTAPPVDEVVSGFFAGENGDLPSELAAALANCSETKLDQGKLASETDPLELCAHGSSGKDVVMGDVGEPGDHNANDFLDMASFLGESEDTKQNLGTLGMDCARGSDDRMMLDFEVNELAGVLRQHGGEASQVETDSVAGNSGDAQIAMGIPYYVACQWQMQQQQQQQQQQAAVMLWWQAYLSSYGGMLGHTGGIPAGFPGNPAGWGIPPPGMQFPPGLFPQLPGTEALFPQLMNTGVATTFGSKTTGVAGHCGPAKRRRRPDNSSGIGDGQGEGLSNLGSPSRKGRRPRQEERVCKNCGTRSTPFWRKDKHDGLPLCNACGLYLSKNDAPRPKVLWKSSEPSSTAVADSNGTCL